MEQAAIYLLTDGSDLSDVSVMTRDEADEFNAKNPENPWQWERLSIALAQSLSLATDWQA